MKNINSKYPNKKLHNKKINVHHIRRPPSLSELTPYQISLGLTHLDLEACISFMTPKALKRNSKVNVQKTLTVNLIGDKAI